VWPVGASEVVQFSASDSFSDPSHGTKVLWVAALHPANFQSPFDVEILSDEKPSDTQRNGELRFYFMQAVPDEFALKIPGPKQRIHRILKGQCKASGYKEFVRVNR
jgi:hypothetical protein